MMFFQGCALATSPQGASHTIFRPGMSGVPDDFAIVVRSEDCADAADEVNAASATISSRDIMGSTFPLEPPSYMIYACLRNAAASMDPASGPSWGASGGASP